MSGTGRESLDKMGKVYAVGVGPGSAEYLTKIAERIIRDCDVVAGYRYTLHTIRHLLDGKQVHEVTMKNQEETYQRISRDLGDRSLLVPFTGDVSFSESEVVDRLVEIFGNVELIPGISSVQLAAAKAMVPLDKSRTITMHVTAPIERKKMELRESLAGGSSVILVPRPWPSRPDKHFMPSEIAAFLREGGLDTEKIRVHVFESLTMENEACFEGTVKELEGREFSDMSVMVFNQAGLDSYMNYKWQWKD